MKAAWRILEVLLLLFLFAAIASVCFFGCAVENQLDPKMETMIKLQGEMINSLELYHKEIDQTIGGDYNDPWPWLIIGALCFIVLVFAIVWYLVRRENNRQLYELDRRWGE